MTVAEIMKELEKMGTAQTKKTFLRHGAVEPLYGVKVGDLKKIVKKVKKNHDLSLSLFETGNSDAMYLAGLIADEKKISKKDLQNWVSKTKSHAINEYTVAWIASESPYGWDLGMEWIESEQESIASAGWATLANWVSLRPDNELDITALENLLSRIVQQIHTARNREKYCMNGFIISLGAYVVPLTPKAIEAAEKIGLVEVNMGDTACKVPAAATYIQKIVDMGKAGKKKKVARC